ncbi:MAG: hypothetical protein M5U07_11205 [Xanthobacteraceae bacterium]|nr:hypothetical protein [Xanthobacteraceae bacterium]
MNREEDDAELADQLDPVLVGDREIGERRHLADEGADAVRPDRDAGQHEADHRVDAQPVEQRHRDPGAAEEHHHVLEGRQVRAADGHAPLRIVECSPARKDKASPPSTRRKCGDCRQAPEACRSPRGPGEPFECTRCDSRHTGRDGRAGGSPRVRAERR